MTKKKFAELELSLLHLQQNVEIPETHLIIHPVIQRSVEQVGLTYDRMNRQPTAPTGPSEQRTTEYILHPAATIKRQLFPQHTALARQPMDQVHSSRHQTHARRIIRHCFSRNQFLVKS